MLITSIVTRAGRKQPNGCHISAAEADSLTTHHRVLQRASQYGDVVAFYGGR